MRRALSPLMILVLRGVLLWLVIPVTVVAWVVTYPVAVLLGKGVRLPQVLGWADLNLIAALQRLLPARQVEARVAFVGWQQIGSVTHRIGFADPV